ncbi:MAG: membrane dipeptidase [Alphaproteobacteria bacterium]|nr:membrane dipeptidase [Alphaproteobacteria bacterium]
MTLAYVDHEEDPAGWAKSLGVSVEAVELLLSAHFIDLHCDMEVPIRVLGYDPATTHSKPRRVRPMMGHTDYGRIREAAMTGVVYDIATNPFRPKHNRLETTLSNIDRAIARIEAHPEEQRVVATAGEYDAARAEGLTGYWLALQGGNAISDDPSVLDGPTGRRLHRITLVHLTSSDLGGTNSPAGADHGVTPLGRDVVAACNRNRVLVDLAHAGKKTFWSALEAHAPDLPPIVSHTGVEGVRKHWRNIDDDQIRAIVERGGVVGIMYQSRFLAPVRYACSRSAILDHIEHVLAVAGEGSAAIGTDYDGMITPPHDLLDVTHHPLLVQDMLDRGWSEARIRGVLGESYLRVVRAIRP